MQFLDTLQCHDVVVSVLENLDIRTLFRLGRVSKYFQSIVKQKDSTLIRAVLLSSFPGITNVPVGMDYSYYHGALLLFYQTGRQHHQYRLSHFIGVRLTLPEDFSYWSMTEEELDEEILFLCILFKSPSCSAYGRKTILKCIADWKGFISLYKTQFIDDAGAILDRISTLMSSCFHFEQSRLSNPPHDLYGAIAMDMDSIPEVARYRQRLAARRSG